MSGSNTATNVRTFPMPETFSQLDDFLLKIGAKEMVSSTKKETEATTAIKWNQSVLGLIATLLTVLGIFAAVLVSYVTLSVNFTNYQKITDEKFLRFENEQRELKNEINRFKEFQLKSEAYRLGVADSHGTKEEKKK